MIWVLQVKIQWDALTLDLQIYEVKSVEVEFNRLLILSDLSWSEHDWNLNLVFFTRHEYLSWNNWEVKIVFLFEISL